MFGLRQRGLRFLVVGRWERQHPAVCLAVVAELNLSFALEALHADSVLRRNFKMRGEGIASRLVLADRRPSREAFGHCAEGIERLAVERVGRDDHGVECGGWGELRPGTATNDGGGPLSGCCEGYG